MHNAVKVFVPPTVSVEEDTLARTILRGARIGNAALIDCPQPNVAAHVEHFLRTDMVTCRRCDHRGPRGTFIADRFDRDATPPVGSYLCSDCCETLGLADVEE